MQVIEAQCSWSWRLTITLHINQIRAFLALFGSGECPQDAAWLCGKQAGAADGTPARARGRDGVGGSPR
jgi:hypothetical protein